MSRGTHLSFQWILRKLSSSPSHHFGALVTTKCSRGLHVAVGMSGGVDSSVSAHLLKMQGHRVTGVFMRNWDSQDETGVCTVDQDLIHAKYAAQVLGIELREVDFSKEYWNHVFNYVLQDYENGRTPNPDIVCNQLIKFQVFLEYAKDVIGAVALATGHYVQTNAGDALENVATLDRKGEPVRLFKGIDPGKDQSFFLSRVSQAALRHTIFPVGGLFKTEVKKIASEIGLGKIAAKDESMGICFIGSRRFKSFINNYIIPAPGNFRHVEDGRVVGQHSGVHQWTVGQRIRLASCSDGALFVISRDPKSNDIIVANGTHHPALYSLSAEVDSPHWISGRDQSDVYSKSDFSILGFRFQHNNVGITHPCCLFRVTEGEFDKTFYGYNENDDSQVHAKSNNDQSQSHTKKETKTRFIVKISEPMKALTPGQFAVFYRGDECIGSACIQRPGPSLFELNKLNVANGGDQLWSSSSLSELAAKRRIIEDERRKAANSWVELPNDDSQKRSTG